MSDFTPSDALNAQRRAADPSQSAWTAANAGSGKTRVLTERVARLLLTGARPEKILCLTFTKAAAAEMRNRLFATLGGWSMAEDAALARDLAALTGGPPPSPDALPRARRLFAEALETPGGLKIQTIHAFCDSLLRRFPLEAGAPPDFSVMQSAAQSALTREILNDLAASEERGVIEDLAESLTESGIEERARAVVAERDLFQGDLDAAALSAAFGVPHPPDEESAVLAAAARLSQGALSRMKSAWAHGGKKDTSRLQALGEAAELGPFDEAIVIAETMLTKKGEPLASPAAKGAKEAEPEWEGLSAHLTEIALQVNEARRAARAADLSLRLNRFGVAFVRRYEAAKRARGLLDFDDLVRRARDLLTRSEARAWALYRLDGGVDHILVDEAQDTSPAQWDVIDAIASEFRAGDGARDEARTSFVVGDEKQSIYSFQGAAPRMFAEMRGRFAKGLAAHGGQREEALSFSFRSAPAILEAVDAVFTGPRAAGLTAEGIAISHAAFHGARAGRVELWPLVEPVPKLEEPEPWAPVDMPARTDPRILLSEQIADRCAALIETGHLPGGGRRVRPGDILILLETRTHMLDPLIRNLKRRGVPVAGNDRPTLLDELAVKDLLALARFAVTPEDDLTLAALLRSPLFDVDEDGIFALAHGRAGRLWPALRAAEARWPREVSVLSSARNDADFLRPYEFFEKALIQQGGRARLVARLGREAEDGMDELLAQALAYEAEGPPSLEGFLAWITAGEIEVKREQESGRNEVRVMTVHGSKGLEAPIVILPDTMRVPDAGQRETLAVIRTNDGPRAAWKMRAEDRPAALTAATAEKTQSLADEHARLLYVAMTRAEDWLIVAGAGDPAQAENRWWGAVNDGFTRLDTRTEVLPGGLGDALIFETGHEAKSAGAEDAARSLKSSVPDWYRQMPSAPPRPLPRVQASSLGGEEWRAGDGTVLPDAARARGIAIHAALEAGVAERGGIRAIIAAAGLEDALMDDAVREAYAARHLTDAAPFFSPQAMAEVALSVKINGARVSGRIDRLLITPEVITFVDFKTDSRPPAGVDAMSAGYLAQLAAYHAALQSLYPGRPITAHILWTALPRLDRVSEAALVAARGHIGGSSAPVEGLLS